MTSAMNAADLAPLLPEIFLLSATCALLLIDLFISESRRGLTHFLSLAVLASTAALLVRAPSEVSVTAFGGMFIRDGVADALKLFIIVVSAASIVYAKAYLQERKLFRGEFHVLVLFAVLGMMVLVSAGNLVTVYLGLELLALSSYALVAIDRDNKRASEAAMKYFVLGSLASGMLLYGMSMIYGATGSLDIASIRFASLELDAQQTLFLLGVVFVLVGIAFKFGAAPFHMWLPDVYQGAPTAITLFIGSAPKLAAFGMAYRLLDGAAGGIEADWRTLIAWLAVASLAIGNVIAIAQTNLKRMLAYSTISHVGFLFLGLANGTAVGFSAAMFYAICYAIMAAGAFAGILLLARKGFEAEEISDFAGLGKRHPMYAACVMLLMGSMAGLPPLLGFWAKLAVIRAAVDADMIWLAITAVVFAVIGAYYYIRVIKVMFFDPPADGVEAEPSADVQLRWLFTINAALMLVLGVFSGPLLAWCERSLGV
ncbi:NADH-quinone oxidoreductase subunit NuoN [Lysobacter sp. CAU 1642]|uniref:NADH-quinone oxidoreductase subunit N n=2 Tax=Pseudomarimonas salicorniae TaxID=2933270 RepID=A0ABT0GJH9_9GAMM|nr:NADH-quinone oxidoreductase subunit NuoN [Lysobacter sp. CAU 1642]MCK7594701.1 NADH-quinone oxidoreductase subunit NuoN [Lysobacter sp. CAU 1642]